MVFTKGTHTQSHAALISLTILITFFLFDATYWHKLLPFPNWYTSSSAHTPPSIDLDKESPQANYGLIDKFVSANLTTASSKASDVMQSLNGTTSRLSSKGKETVPSRATPQENLINSSTVFINLSSPEILSLRMLEAGLQTVRSSLRKAVPIKERETVLIKKNGERALRALDYQSQQYLPWGPIYRDASIFNQSYIEMERRFKVFIYPEGDGPLVHNGPCKEIYSSEGRFIQELHHNHHFVTSNPLEAHVFFLPFSVAMMVAYLYEPSSKDMSPLVHFIKTYVDVVEAKYPFWNRSDGADHFMLSCHDWGPYLSRSKASLAKHGIRVLCNANISEGFVPDKDASLPEINLNGGNMPATLGGPPMKDREILAFFAGGEHGPVRPVLYKYWEGRDDDVKVFRKVPLNSKYTYHELMKRSKFCLCPGGYEVNSPRIVEAIYNDCIPVIIADEFVLPFSDVLNWDAFSIKVMQKDIPKLKEILQAVPDSECAEMQARVKQVRRHFIFNQPPQPYDTFHMILHSVWLRRLNIRLMYS